MTRKSRPFWNRLTQAMTAQAVKTDVPQSLRPATAVRPLALEQRFMFDGAAAVDVAHAATDAGAVEHTADTTSALRHALTAEAQRATEGPAGSTQRQEVVFIDGQVSNVGELLAGLSANAEVVVLDPSKDGLQQMADYLKGRENLDAIHLLSHGADGTVQLGNVWLASTNLAEHRAALESIGAALKADGDLMIYGCDVGQGDKGQAFIDQLASITGADVAASVDDTGSVALGGNWTLERSSGTIETNALNVTGYDALMASSYSTSTVFSGVVLGTGNNLMKYVLADFNGDGRADVLFQASGTGGAWSFASSNADGSYTIQSQASSMFAGLTLGAASTGGTNFQAADFNGDGRVDLLVASITDTSMKLYLNTGTGFNATNVSGTFGGVKLLVGDYNGDGSPDVLYQGSATNAAWGMLLNNGNGTFTTVVDTDSNWALKNIVLPNFDSYVYKAADVDGDGYTDLLVIAGAQQMKYYRNNHGTFVDMTSTANLPTPTVSRAIVADFDGDGDADILYQMGGDGTDIRYVRNDNGTFVDLALSASPFAGLTMPDFTGQRYRAADIDGDGDLDLVATYASSNTTVFLQSGSLPKLVSSTPADNSLTVTPSANITLTFDQSVTKGTGNIYIVRTSDNTIIQTIDVTSSRVTGIGNTWTIDPPADMLAGESYAVRIDNKTFANANGQVYKGIQNNTALNFTVASTAAPVIANLNSDAVNYTEKSSGVLIDQGSNAVVTDADSANFNGGSVRVSVTGGAVTGEDVLSVLSLGTAAGQISVSGSNVLYGGVTIGSVTGGTGGNALVITLNASADAAAVTALVQSLQYSNSNTTTPNTGARTVSVTVTDDTGTTSSAAAITVNILAVNDAPVVSVTATNPTFTEDGSAVAVFSGASVSAVEAGQTIILMTIQVTNVANTGVEKLTIDGTDVTLTAGFNTTTANNGMSVTVSLNTGTANVTVTHAGLSTATAQTIINNVTYRNESNAPIGTSRTVKLTNVRDSGGTNYGGQNTVSPNVASVVTLVAVNDAPVLTGGPYVIPSTNENTTSGNVTVSTILAGVTYSDPDSAAASGIAVTATTGRGTWQYSTDGTTWTAFGTVSTSSALLLGSSTQVRYIPDNANGENVSITFRAWDRTSGFQSTNGVPNTGDTTANGGTTAYSSGTANATLIVTSVNDAPVITPVNPNMTGLTDSSTNNNGDAVNTLLGGVTDVDTGALKGIVINGLTATYGKWQFSTNNGTTWNDIGSVSDTAALLLRPADRVRFVPDGLHGETATLTFRAWDQTSSQGYQGTKINVTSNGGATAFSSTTDTASVVVTAVNDAPIITGSGGSVGWTEGNNVTSTPVVVDSGIIISDPDGPAIAYVRVQVTSNYASGEDVLGFSNTDMAVYGDITGVWNTGLGTLTLTSSSGVATQAQFQAALRAVTYTNTSEAPIVANRTVTFQANDGSLNSNVVSRSVTITAVNDSPVINAPGNVTVTEDTPTPITGIVFSDVDSSSGTVTFTVASGTITGTTGVSGITMGGTGSTLTLSGTLASLNAYIAAGNLKYIPEPDSITSVTLGISLDTASVSTDTRNLTIDITAVNDAPTISTPVSINVTEDVPKSLAGITFFDVDAGTGSVTVIFSVASGDGTFTATASSGVTISNSGTNVITLEGSIADINTLISNGHLTYLGALNANGAKVMSVSINDNGNSGTGGPLSERFDVSLMIAAVNDAPINSIPSQQTMFQDGSLTFNTANGNLISVSDVDIAGNQMKVTLSATNGLLTLGQISGLTFTTGDGTADSEMTFAGSISAINAALNGLTFSPTAGYTGTASLTILSDDQGYVGAGGAKTDVDTLLITVSPANPKVTGVVAAPGSDGQHKVGDQIDIVVNFDNAVIVDQTSGSPTLLLETGAIDRQAQYISGTGTNQLTFRYTVQAGDLSADLDYASTSALSLNGAVLQSAQGFSAILTLPTVGGASSLAGQQAIVVDGIVPTISSVQLPSDGNYHLGQNLDFTVNFSEAVTVDSTGGTPRLAVTLDTGGTVYADYLSGSGGSALVFRLSVTSGQLDTDGIRVAGNVQLNGGSIRDAAGNDSTTGFIAPSTSGILVDGVVPAVADVIVPANGGYKAGDVLSFTVNASEAVFTSGSPRLAVDVGGITRYATFVPGSSVGTTLVFQYTVQAGDNDADGISVASSLDLNGGSVKDAAGNDLNLTLNSVGSTTEVLVDTTVPTVTSIVRVGGSPSNSGSVSYTVTFSEDVSGVDISDFTATFGGTSSGSLASVTQVDGHTYTVVIDNLAGAGNVTLSLNGSGTGIRDAADNLVSAGLTGETYAVDRVAPAVTSVSVPSNGTYVAGQDIDFTVNLGEATLVDTSGGTPRIQVTLDNGQTAWANYVSGTGTTALVFRLTVANGQLDTDGITVDSAIQLNGATLRDAVGNDANLNLNNVGDTSGVKVDAVVPQVSSVDLPANGSYKAGDVLNFTVNTSEGVVVDTLGGTPRLVLTVGGVTRYANYVSGAAGGALVFQYTVQSGDTAASGISVNSTLDLNGGHVNDPAGNALNLNLGAVGNTGNVLIDTTTPYATNITRVDTTPTNSGSVSYTVTFSENVRNVDASDFNLIFGGTVAGAIESVTAVDGKTFTVKVSGLTGTGTVRLDLRPGTDIADTAGNLVPGGRVGVNYAIDRDVPTVTGVEVPANGTYVAGQNLDFTVHLSENVQLNTSGGSPRLEVLLDNGQTAWADYVSGAGTSALVFRLTVATGQLDTNGITVGNNLQLNGATLRDSVGNDAQLGLNGLPPTDGVLVDAVAPVVSSVVSPADGSYKAGDTLSFSVNASESLRVIGSPRLVLDVGGVTRYATLVSGSNSSTLVFQYTVQAGDNDANGISVSGSLDLNGGSVRDAAGNDLALTLNGLGATSGVIIDTVLPTATIVVADNALSVGETSLVTITFSEAVTGLDISDFSVEHGALSHLMSSDGGITWTATLTPTAGITDTSNVITLDNTGYVDAAGNTGAGSTDSNNYAIDTQRPTAAIVVTDNALAVGETSTVTVTFSEAVSGLTTADFSVEHGTLSNLSSSDGGITWTATLTPTAGITNASNVIRLDNTGYVDAAGNTGSGTTNSNHYAIDTQRPTATIVVADTALAVGETSTVTITFSEAVSGLDIADFSVEHGSLSHLMSSDGGIIWTATLTPTAGITGTSNVITLNNTGYVDAAGNSGTGTTASNVYAIDTQDPVAPEITLDQATLVDGRQVSPTGLVIISGLEAGGSWQYSLDNGASWLEGRGNSVQLPGLGAFSLWVLQKDAAGNASPVTSLNGIVEPLVPPAVQPPSQPAMNDLPAGLGLAPFQASEVSEPNADFLQSTSAPLNMSSQRGGMHGSEHWSGYGVPQSIAGVNDWMGVSLFAPTEVIRSGFDPVPEQFSVSTGASILDLKPVLLASDSPWDIASLRFSFVDRQELPGWVRLDRQSGQLTINAPKDFSTTLVLQIKVSDGKGHESVRTVKVVIGDARATSSAPAGRAGLSEKMANAANQQAGKRMSMYVHG
ncbi:Ig-like domain-containing protein [Comamonas sp. Tr-654]|uniref:Ig-like domain-containing protein n=1 Tax=Comamonas sp. Tr-654 TaxID=2608341 RepID=UPI0014211DF1|nr:Ig-like domain-containing protein [Comamonas sp. Tr-654]